MATVDYWAEAPLEREQMMLFSPTLDAMISDDDPVRLFDEVLGGVDWSSWESEYNGRVGQPPIHPRYMAAALLYGLCRRIRSSRALEEACCYRFDFIWLVHGRRIDHTTFAKFRTKFAGPLKDLFKQVCRIAMDLGLVRLAEVAFDGTRVQASNSRYATRTAKTLEEKLAALDRLYDELLGEMEKGDAAESSRDVGEADSPTRLPEGLSKLEERRERVRAALVQARAADEARRKDGVNPHKNPAQVPTTDPQSRVMPNKEGGYAPNYTPTATTDSQCGMIVDCEVVNTVNESDEAVASVDRIEETLGQKPEKFLTDGGNNSGVIMAEMEERDVEFYAPAKSSQPQEGNPAQRDDPTKPVDESQWPQLPRNPQGKLDKSCFTYNAEEDQYYCPQGKAMPFAKNNPDQRGKTRVDRRVYRCPSCAGCPLAEACLSPKSKKGRTITRDEHEEVRERTAARMATEEARQLYNQRPRIAETPFGTIKGTMGVRKFLLRGLEKVKTEWRWACTAFNLAKLVREIAKLRAQHENFIATEQG